MSIFPRIVFYIGLLHGLPNLSEPLLYIRSCEDHNINTTSYESPVFGFPSSSNIVLRLSIVR